MPDEARHIRPFSEFLHLQRAGALQVELGEALNEVVEAVNETGKAGKVTLTVSVKPIGKSTHGQLLVTDTVKVSKPEGERGESIFFADDDHNLVRDNPNQPEIPGLREVPRPAQKDLAAGAGVER
jgi:hypothetical protein